MKRSTRYDFIEVAKLRGVKRFTAYSHLEYCEPWPKLKLAKGRGTNTENEISIWQK